ncbi:MAG TPA: TIGR00159 family protein [Candidatus Omnitrophica bacterium]|nr:MAG: TIGR00159 family protein [Omnitrophica WOR_2 bacterium GWA2_45_18]HBR15509.1 TIGR00159 family protein [Candidatus Omnitrophota bacterium]
MTFFLWWNYIKPALEICILWIVFYRILVFFEGTRAFQVLRGIIYLLIAFLVSQFLGFDILNWLLTNFFAISIIALMIIFQPELRQGLARLGQQHLFNIALEESEMIAIIEELTSAVYKLSRQKIGGLMAIERETKLRAYIESGIQIDAKVSSELIQSIFNPLSPMHDGGIIIHGDRILAAACLFPLSDNPNFSKSVGTRHRASLGITEQTDAVVIMASEETGEISVAHDGKFIHITDREKLVHILKNLLIIPKKKKNNSNTKTQP